MLGAACSTWVTGEECFLETLVHANALSMWRLVPCRLDTNGRCYLEPRDWGSPGALHLVEQFSLMYLRKHMGFPNPTSSPEQVGRHPRTKPTHSTLRVLHTIASTVLSLAESLLASKPTQVASWSA
jgi:hypothetical protein